MKDGEYITKLEFYCTIDSIIKQLEKITTMLEKIYELFT